MNQSAILTSATVAGFALFLASRDRLSLYARTLWGDKPGSHSQPTEKEDGFGFDFGDVFKQFELPDLPELPEFNWMQ